MNGPQPAIWEYLLRMLSEAKISFQQYLKLLALEEHTLRIMDRQGLTEVNSQKEQVLDTMCRLEPQIERAFQQLAGIEGQKSLWRWLRKSEDPRAQSAHGLLTELLGLAGLIQDQGKKNEALICRTQLRVREAIHYMSTEWSPGPLYQGSGSLNFPSVPSSVHLQG